MGPAFNAHSSSSACVLTDQGTWLSFKSRGELAVSQSDKRLFNQYGFILVKHPHVKVRRDLARSIHESAVIFDE